MNYTSVQFTHAESKMEPSSSPSHHFKKGIKPEITFECIISPKENKMQAIHVGGKTCFSAVDPMKLLSLVLSVG